MESAIKFDGDVGFAQGLSLVRPVFRVDITALMGSEGGAAAKAADTSVGERALPPMMERLGCGGRAAGRRTRAVTVWFRARASARARVPVRPVAPRRRMRIFGDGCSRRCLVFGCCCCCCSVFLRINVLKLSFGLFLDEAGQSEHDFGSSIPGTFDSEGRPGHYL